MSGWGLMKKELYIGSSMTGGAASLNRIWLSEEAIAVVSPTVILKNNTKVLKEV